MFRKVNVSNKRRKPRPGIVRFKKKCVFCQKKLEIDYKNIELLSRYVSSKGKMISRRISGNCAKHQRKISKEIKRARFLNLIPYVGR
ncbi:MAG: 30S ribosomal protein S18 [Candidatus Omnitrophota bacterium]|nr:MAG: 30S ribosomal protein S18 [Candidatus Omnitrophota bacterium]